MEGIKIRNAGILDFLNLRKITVDDRRSFDNPIFCAGEKPVYPTWFGLKPYLKFFYYYFHPKKHVIFAEKENKIAGAAVLSGNMIEGFFVNKPFRGSGLGTILMGHVLEKLAQKKYGTARIGVQVENSAAKNFYKKAGFLEKEAIMERRTGKN